jgi:hypothetical protein
MSDGGRERASLGLEVRKSFQKWSVQRSAVRSIAWLDEKGRSMFGVKLGPPYWRTNVFKCLADLRMEYLTTRSHSELNITQAVTVTFEPCFLSVNGTTERTNRLVNRISDGIHTIFGNLRPELVPIGVGKLAASEEESQINDVMSAHRLSSSEKKINHR